MPVRRPDPTTSLPLVNQAGLTFYDDGAPDRTRATWLARGRTLLVLVLVVGGGTWLVRRVSQGIDTATQEAGRAMELSLKARDEADKQNRRQLALAQELRHAEERKQEAERAFTEAAGLEATGKPLEAAEAYQAFLTRFPQAPQAPQALFQRARALLAAHDTPRALSELMAFKEAHAGHPAALEVEVLLAESFLALNRNGEAIETTTRFLAAHEASALSGRVRLTRARAELRLGSREDARKDAEWLKGRYTSSDPLYQQADALLGELGATATAGPP
jgi:tetratricopeptide (TPR) repeat protein